MAERTFLDDLADLKRRVRDLETATRNPQISGGDIDDIDEGYDGAIILNRRQTDIDPTSGDFIALLIAQYGWELPAMPAQWTKLNDSQAVTAGVFTVCYWMQYHQAIADGFQCEVSWATDPGTTGELRLNNEVVGGNTSNTVTLGAGSSGVQLFTWLHGQTIGFGPLAPAIKARRTGGAGNVTIYAPKYGYQVGGRWISATSGGT